MLFRSLATAALMLTAATAATPAAMASPSASSASLAAIAITPVTGNYVISAANPSPLISGTVTELAPGATTPAPYADQTVVIEDSVNGEIDLETTSTGFYSYQPNDPAPGETITVQVPASATNEAAAAPTVTLSAQVLLTAKLSASEVRYGATVSVSGSVVSYAAGSGDRPLAGEPVQVYATGGQLAATTTTTASGTFTTALPREPAGLSWTVQTGGGPDLATATAMLPMTVDLPTAVTGFKATLSPLWQVSFQGCLGLVPGTPGYVPSLAGLTVQYAASARGPWHALGRVPTAQRSYVCGDDGRTFSGALPGRLNDAYYRVVYAGGAASAGSGGAPTGYLPSVSGTVHSVMRLDRITGFKVTPRAVRRHGKLTVSGKLQYYSGKKWLDLSKQSVLVILRPAGSKSWYWIARAKTNARGDFTVTFTDPVSATWAAEYLGDKTNLATVSPMLGVTVRG